MSAECKAANLTLHLQSGFSGKSTMWVSALWGVGASTSSDSQRGLEIRTTGLEEDKRREGASRADSADWCELHSKRQRETQCHDRIQFLSLKGRGKPPGPQERHWCPRRVPAFPQVDKIPLSMSPRGHVWSNFLFSFSNVYQLQRITIKTNKKESICVKLVTRHCIQVLVGFFVLWIQSSCINMKQMTIRCHWV